MIELNERKKELFDRAMKDYKAGLIADPRYSFNSLRKLSGQVVSASETLGVWMSSAILDNEQGEKQRASCKNDFALSLADIVNTVLTIASIENIDIEKAINENYYKNKKE